MTPPLDRRALLGLAGAAAAAGLAPRLGASRRVHQESAPARRIQKCLKLGMVQVDAPLAERFRLLARLGFDGVELDSPSDLDPAEVLAAKEASGLEIPGVVDSVHWRATLGDPDPAVRDVGRAALETALRDCKLYGGTTVLLVPAVVDARIAYDEAYERSQAEIRRVLPLAAELGVRIALENVWNNFLLSPLEAARYVDELESEHVGWYMDVGNVVHYGWPVQWIRILGRRILALDVKGFSRAKADREGRWKGFEARIGEAGEDDGDWPAVMRALDGIGYRGWASAEVRGGGEERLREISERLDRVLASG